MRRTAGALAAALLPALVACSESRPAAAPFPPSPQIAAVEWDFARLATAAPGSDLWPTSWAVDGQLYTAWGDGGGFGGDDVRGRVSLGVARIEGPPEDWRGVNVLGGFGAPAPELEGKPALVAAGGRLVLYVTEQGGWRRAKVGVSRDGGRSFRFAGGSFADSDWDFAEPGGAFANPVPIQFGRDNAGSPDGFVYLYSERSRGDGRNRELLLARVAPGKIRERGAYRFFAGTDADGAPRWTPELERAVAAFRDPNGVNWGAHAVFHPQLERYWLTTRRHDRDGGRHGAWGWFDAPTPWGPWTTVAWYEDWDAGTPIEGIGRQIGYGFPSKWLAGGADAATVWMVASLDDAFYLLPGRLSLRSSPSAAPAASATSDGRSSRVTP